MCIICIEYQQNKLTAFEALNIVREYDGIDKIPQEHLAELNKKLLEDIHAQEEYYAIKLDQENNQKFVYDLAYYDDSVFDFED